MQEVNTITKYEDFLNACNAHHILIKKSINFSNIQYFCLSGNNYTFMFF